MAGFFDALFGRRSVVKEDQSGDLVVEASDPRALVKEWNALKAEYDRADANWTPVTAGQTSDLKQKMRLIEDVCVTSHVVTQHADGFVQQAMQRYQGRDLHGPLDSFDHEAITALQGRIVGSISENNRSVAERFLMAHNADLDAMPEEDADRVRSSVSGLIWCFLTAFYEIAVVTELGQPENIYVGMNIRDLFVGTRCQYLEKQGAQIERSAVKADINSFADDWRENIKGYFTGRETRMARIFSHLIGSGVYSCADDMAETLDKAFHAFAAERKDSIRNLIAHG